MYTKKIKAFIAPSEFLIKKYHEFGFKPEITLLPNIMQKPTFLQKGDYEKNVGEGILYVGRFSREKGIERLFQKKDDSCQTSQSFLAKIYHILNTTT